MNEDPSFDAVAASLAGLTIGHVWRGFGSAVFLEIGDLAPQVFRDGTPGQPQGEITLCVEWSWRIERGHSILCGSWSSEELWEKGFDQLIGARIRTLELFGILPEIILSTERDTRFLSFCTTDGQPRWCLTDRRESAAYHYTVTNGVIGRKAAASRRTMP